MSIKDGFLIELERETANTRRIIDRLNDENLAYKPHVKSMSLGELVCHIVELHNWVGKYLTKSGLNFETDYSPLSANNVADIKSALENGFKLNRETIEGIPDEDWLKSWVLRSGDYVIADVPRIGALRYIVNNHLIHHRGQVTVYLRLLNIPVPGIYGPSADDNQ